MIEIKIHDLDDIGEAARTFISGIGQHKKFAFYGKMGAGKTTFINAVLDQMGIEDHSSSPTFSIVNEYFSVNFGKIYHFDFYRLKDEEEAYDIGVEEIFEEDAFLFMEWPEQIANLIPEDCVRCDIAEEKNYRLIRLEL